MGTGLGCAGDTLIKNQGDLIKSRCGSRQSSHHPFDTHHHPLHIYIYVYIFVYTQLDPVKMVMEVTAMMQNMYTYTIQVYALVLTVK